MKKPIAIIVLAFFLNYTTFSQSELKMSDFMKENAESLGKLGTSFSNLSKSISNKELSEPEQSVFDFAFFTNEQKNYLLVNGFHALKKAGIYTIRGVIVPKEQFAYELGLFSDSGMAKIASTRSNTAIFFSIITALIGITGTQYGTTMSRNEMADVITYAGVTSLIASGGLLLYSYAQKSRIPPFPSFEVLAIEANRRNLLIIQSM